jgi:hypothetical protein
MSDDEKDVYEVLAAELDMDQSEIDMLKVTVMESHEKAQNLLDKVGEIGQRFAIKDGDDIFVNVAWLGTMLLMEAEQTIRGHGGCPDHTRVVDLLQTSTLAALKAVGEDTI